MARGTGSNNNSNSSKINSSTGKSLSKPAPNDIGTTSDNPSVSSGENPTGLFARLQTPEGLEYMRYFVLFNSVFILLAMGIPTFFNMWK